MGGHSVRAAREASGIGWEGVGEGGERVGRGGGREGSQLGRGIGAGCRAGGCRGAGGAPEALDPTV
eukprot:SAG11_NODE_3260_length_2570_cov_54.796117_2_plen_66_part_00